ncbi:hypothetical protein ACVIYL_004608 [Bradyrhizobium sp. USDA 3315]
MNTTITTSKPFSIDKRSVVRAYKAVKSKRGAAGVDGQTLGEFDKDLKGNLYKIWNRMSSGSYFPPSVRAVSIPKKGEMAKGFWMFRPSAIASRRWLLRSTLNRFLIQFFFQTPMVTDRRNRPWMPWVLRASGAGSMIGFLNSTSKDYWTWLHNTPWFMQVGQKGWIAGLRP